MESYRKGAFFLLFVLFINLTPIAHAQEPIQPPFFTPSNCMFPIPAGAVEGQDVACGYLTVLEEHENPNGRTIRLAVAIIKSKFHEPRADPLVMAQGGPGGSTIDAYAETLLNGARLRANRDIVLFDQRGTYYSVPNLVCDEIFQLTLDTLEKDISQEEYARLEAQALKACKDRLENENINLDAYDSWENASDIADLAEVLGYQQINLYGVSYGTLLALHVLGRTPEILRSVILDAVVPPDINFNLNVAQTMDRSFTRLFESCKQNAACNKAYPELEKVFYQTYERLEKQPANWPMFDPVTAKTYHAVIDGETLQSGLFQLLYIGSLIPALPRMIYDATRDNFDFFSRILAIIIFDRTNSDGMYFSTFCAEDSDFTPQDQDLTGVRPQIVAAEAGDPQELLQLCKMWDVDPLPHQVDEPVISDLPVLLLSGEFDPVTPPSYATRVAKTLSHGYQVVFPTGSHGAAFDGECQDSIILAFLEDPASAPPIECITSISEPVFYTPKTVVDAPVILKLLNLDPIASIQFIVFFSAVVVLLSAGIMLPFAWIIRSLKRKPVTQVIAPRIRPTLLSRSAGWLAFLNGMLLSAFGIGISAVVVRMYQENDNRLFFGLSAQAKPWFILPLISAMITSVMLATLLHSWRKRHWSIWARIYFAVLNLASLSGIAVLVWWGFIQIP